MALIAKLNPPQISSKLPAFAEGKLRIPFNLNRAVGRNQFETMSVIIRTVSTNVQKAILFSKNITPKHGAPGEYVVEFTYNDGEFQPQVGQYYKVQLACVDTVSNPEEPVVGYYSSVGVIKHTAKPRVIIRGREGDGILNNTYEYTGLYSQEGGDPTEKVYSYCFNLYDENNKLVATSGEQVHNSSTDVEVYESTDVWTLRKKLTPNINYQIEYSITTMNGYSDGSGKYSVLEASTVPPNLAARLKAIPNREDAYIDLLLVGDGLDKLYSGSFILLRSSSEDNYDSWYELTKFQLAQWNAQDVKQICRDYTIQQGVSYIYAIQAYNSVGLFSDRMTNEEGAVTCDFEDAFLYDGERQLKIRFNPKVSTFKSTVLETKIDTLGGQYPFIFRNGDVNYKEFAVSGLLSLVGDENNEFKTNIPAGFAQAAREETPSLWKNSTDQPHWLTGENYYKEREFKIQALEWLNNGQPKLFKSSAEGNFIVRLMNVTLTPMDMLGRMLHTFNANAYEIAECSFDNLHDYGFLVKPYLETRTLKMKQISLKDYQPGEEITLPEPAYVASLVADPLTSFSYSLAGYSTLQKGCSKTGLWDFGGEEILSTSPLLSLTLDSEKWGSKASLTYGYYDTAVNTFSYIHKIDISDQVVQLSGKGLSENLINDLTDIRKRVGVFHYLRVRVKNIQPIEFKNSHYQIDDTTPILQWNSNTLYKYGNYYLDSTNMPELNLEPSVTQVIPISNKETFYFSLNNSPVVDFKGRLDQQENTTGRYEALTSISPVTELSAGKGLIIDAVYQLKEIVYTVETERAAISGPKSNWQHYLNEYQETQNEDSLVKAELWYSTYIEALWAALDEIKEEYNVEYVI